MFLMNLYLTKQKFLEFKKYCIHINAFFFLCTGWMIQKYGKECPDIVRLYGNSLENKDFPTLGKYFSSRGSERDSKPDPKLMEISVHRLIRLEDKPNSEEIRKFDDLFQKYSEGEYEPTLENLKTYRRITSLAAQEELKQHRVIFCTTAVATSPRFIKALTGNIQQLIIDEAGMCTEPESIAAIIATKAQQVVLIGDHKQLRPVLKSTHAAKLGLETSLFERYSDRANMLQIQYRMVRIFLEYNIQCFQFNKVSPILVSRVTELITLITVAAIIWLKYCRYGLQHQSINHSINRDKSNLFIPGLPLS